MTIDAQELVYAYSQTCSTSLTITSNDIEFVDDFKSEYFTFDNPDDIKGKTYVINRTSAKTIEIAFTGAYSGSDLAKDNNKEIKYKINKSAFKNSKVTEDATGKMYMTWDHINCTEKQLGTTDIWCKCPYTFNSVAPTKITLNTSIDETAHNLSDYCSVATVTGTIKFIRHVSYDNKIDFQLDLDDLPNEGEDTFPIKISNKTGAELFGNIPENYGLTFYIKKNSENHYDLDSEQSNFYFENLA